MGKIIKQTVSKKNRMFLSKVGNFVSSIFHNLTVHTTNVVKGVFRFAH
jgi:hypothetical protein